MAPEVDFYLHDRDFATASLEPWAHPHKTEAVRCPLTTIDELTRDWQRLDMVKIDAEGAELAVWRGMQETLKRFPGVVTIIELHFDRAVDEVEALLEEIQGSGPTIRRIAEDGRPVCVAPNEIHQAAGQHWTMWLQG